MKTFFSVESLKPLYIDLIRKPDLYQVSCCQSTVMIHNLWIIKTWILLERHHNIKLIMLIGETIGKGSKGQEQPKS